MKLKDRYLVRRGETWSYRRSVPKDLEGIDARFPHVVKALHTRDKSEAKLRRDIFAGADDRLWNALRLGKNADTEWETYEAAIETARAMDLDPDFDAGGEGNLKQFANAFNYAMEITTRKNLQTLGQDGLDKMLASPSFSQVNDALMHNQCAPFTTVRQAFNIFCDEIMASELNQKSEAQLRKWKNPRDASVNLFVRTVGDKDITKITREDGLTFYRQIKSEIDCGQIGANAANKKFTPMRKLFEAYHNHIGEFDTQNPFDRLNFREGPQRSRPPFSLEWIQTKLIQPAKLEKLNEDARDIWLTLIDTGARLSEICNLLPESIHLDHEVPHIVIQPIADGENKRQIKTHTSIRKVPLVGLALDAMKRHPNGFERYRDKEESLSAILRKWLKENGLKETENHVPYSLRHSYEDRMKEAGIDEELRKILAGHTIDRPRYGEGGTLSWKRGEMLKLVFKESVSDNS